MLLGFVMREVPGSSCRRQLYAREAHLWMFSVFPISDISKERYGESEIASGDPREFVPGVVGFAEVCLDGLFDLTAQARGWGSYGTDLIYFVACRLRRFGEPCF